MNVATIHFSARWWCLKLLWFKYAHAHFVWWVTSNGNIVTCLSHNNNAQLDLGSKMRAHTQEVGTQQQGIFGSTIVVHSYPNFWKTLHLGSGSDCKAYHWSLIADYYVIMFSLKLLYAEEYIWELTSSRVILMTTYQVSMDSDSWWDQLYTNAVPGSGEVT